MHSFALALLLAAGGLKGVVGAEKADALPTAAREGLTKDGFTILEGREKHFFSLYDRNAYEKVPSFISADVILHVFHARFDDELAGFEHRRLLPALKAFSSGQLARALALWPKQGAPEPALQSLTVFHAVAVALLDENATLDPRVAAAATTESKALKDGKGSLKVCAVDASLFTPRGHSERFELRGYFMASTWYAQCVFPLDRSGLPRALDVLRLLDAPATAALRELEAARALVGGPADDPGVTQLEAIAGELPSLPAPLSAQSLDAVLARVATLKKGRVASLNRGPVLALLGAAGTFDGEVLGAVAAKKRLPSALDVLAELGSVGALRLLGRPPPRAGQAVTLARGGGLAQRWLDVLALLVGPAPAGQPKYALTSAWEGRVLTSAAGSWAELKHDTLLYVKQPLVMREGGHEAELPAAKVGGFVDPRPDVYRALQAMNDALQALHPQEKTDDGPGDFLRFVIEVSEVELAGKPFPKEMNERLRTIGGELEHLARTRGDRPPPQAIVADVLTIEIPDQPREVLHVGVGDVDELWIVVPLSGKQVLMRGGVFSYYEFARAARLTDSTFIEELGSLKPPARPFWARPVAQPLRRKNKD